MFDHELALSVGLNPATDGKIEAAVGIGGRETIAVAPIDLVIPAFSQRSWTVHAQFKRLSDGTPAILGHGGFLGRMTATFIRGREFEPSDIRFA